MKLTKDGVVKTVVEEENIEFFKDAGWVEFKEPTPEKNKSKEKNSDGEKNPEDNLEGEE